MQDVLLLRSPQDVDDVARAGGRVVSLASEYRAYLEHVGVVV